MISISLSTRCSKDSSPFLLRSFLAFLVVAVLSPQTGQAQQFEQAPAPPAMIVPAVPEVQQSSSATVPEPSNPDNSSGLLARSSTSLLIENGENGTDSIEDHTDSTYELLQDGVAAQGDYAFHLAAPRFGDWFAPTSSAVVASDTKLFFLSRLGFATSAQTATVQVSTDSGATWSSTVWTQSGTGDSGESGFSLNEVDLSAFDGQSIRIRFLFDFSGGTFFPQTDLGVGWYVDNIQIGSSFSKELYTRFGDPSDDEQHYLEYINRARASAAAEAIRLRNESDPVVSSTYSFFGIAVNDIPTQFAWYVSSGCMAESAQPLAFNTDLLRMARLHTQDMFDNVFQGHVSSDSPPAPFLPGDTLGNRLARVGYSGAAGENVFSFSRSVAHGHAGFDVDWGDLTDTASACYNASLAGQGMQNPSGHRLAIHNGAFREIGVGVINGTNGTVGPQLVTQNFGGGGSRVITGVVYLDSNNNSFYDPGEGISGVRIDTPDSAFYSVTSNSGGYALPVDSDATHSVTFSEGGVSTFTMDAVVSEGNNTKLDYVPTSLLLLGDVNQDGLVNFFDISPFIAILTNGTFLAEADLNQDGIVSFLDIAPFIAIISG